MNPSLFSNAVSAVPPVWGVHVFAAASTLTYGGTAVLAAVLFALTFALFSKAIRNGGGWLKRIVQPATPEALAAVRVVVFSVILLMVLREDLASTALIPRSVLDPRGKGMIALLVRIPGYLAFSASGPALFTFQLILVALTLAGLLGFKAKVTMPATLVGYTLFGAVLRQYTHFFHQGLIPLYVLLVLAFTPAAEAWSVDAHQRRKKNLPTLEPDQPTWEMGVALWSIWAMIGLVYLAAGVAKIRNGGLAWWGADNLRSHTWTAALQPEVNLPFPAALARAPNFVLAALGIGTVVVEVGAVFVLVSRRVRLLAAPAIFALHFGIFLGHALPFFDLMILPLVFAHPHHLAKVVRSIFYAPGRARVHLHAIWVDSGFRNSASGENGSPELRVPRSALLLIALIAATTAPVFFRLEGYPITSWQMYSGTHRETKVTYLDSQAECADGSLVSLRFDTHLKALHDNRHHTVVASYFDQKDPESKRRLHDLVARVVELHNLSAPPAKRYVSAEVSRREWNWGIAPFDFHHGQIVDVYTYQPDN